MSKDLLTRYAVSEDLLLWKRRGVVRGKEIAQRCHVPIMQTVIFLMECVLMKEHVCATYSSRYGAIRPCTLNPKGRLL
jgi:hypothetical protein